MTIFNAERIFADARMEETSRKTSVDRIAKYISDKFPIAESGESSIIKSLQDVSPQEFTSFLQSVNATVRGLEVKDIEQFPHNIKVKTPDFSIFQKTDFVYPRAESRREIMDEVTEKIKRLATQADGESKQAIAHTLYNAVTYLHPFSDGNGRTARLLYFLCSPHIKRSPTNMREMVQHLAESRNKNIDEYHDQLNQAIYQIMLRKRGLPEDAPDGDYACQMDDAETLGFDGVYLQMLAAADVLTDEEKQKYNTSKHPGALSFNGFDFTDDIKSRIKAKMEDIRTEFIRDIVEISTYTNTPDWLTEPLDEAFTTKKKEDL